jgi:hypothetical protein
VAQNVFLRQKKRRRQSLAVKLLPPSDDVRQPASSFFRYRRHVRLGASSSKTRALFLRESKILFVEYVWLSSQTQPSHNFVIPLDVDFLQIIKQTTSLLDHHQQPAPRMIVLLVYLEMLGEFVDSLA